MFGSRLNRIVCQAIVPVFILLIVRLAAGQVVQHPRAGGVNPPPSTQLNPNDNIPPASVIPAGKPVITKKGNLTITETLLPTPNVWITDVSKVSPDGQRVVIIGIDEKMSYVLCDKYQSPRYDMIQPKSILFSPDGKRIAFITKQDGKAGVVLSDSDLPIVDDLGGWMGFSNDSKHFAFVGLKDKKFVMYYDGKPIATYDGIGQGWFSPDSSHFAFVGRKGTMDVIVLDGTERQTYPQVAGFLYSPKANRLAVLVRSDNKFRMILDDKASKEYDAVDPNQMVFSPDGKRFAYTAGIGDKQIMVVAGEFEKEYQSAGSPYFSPDSKRLAYPIGRNGKYVMVLDGVEGKEYDLQQSLTFSPDSKHIAYCAQTKDVSRYVIDGVEGKVDFTEQWASLTWSPAGNHYSYIASKGAEHFAVIDDVKSKSYAGEQESTGVTWSADGRHVAHVLSPDRTQFLILIDGKYETPPFTGVCNATVAFDAKGKAHCVATKNGRFYHMEIAINP